MKKTQSSKSSPASSLTDAIAQSLLQINAVGFAPQSPITFKSGIVSPVYVDNRKYPYHPSEWQKVLIGFQELIQARQLKVDVVAGVATAGIPHSATLGYLLRKPSVFIRKESKDHGTKKLVEGGEVADKRVLLIEDHLSTGLSSLRAVEALRAEGAVVADCLVITSYDFSEAKQNFEQAKVRLHTLTTFQVILAQAFSQGLFSQQEKKVIEDWFNDPKGWAERHGFS